MRNPVAVFPVFLLFAGASAQVPRVVLAEGELLPGWPTNEVLVDVGIADTNRVGGFAFGVRVAFLGQPLSHALYGSLGGEPERILRVPQTLAGLTQLTVGLGVTLDDAGRLAYTSFVDGGRRAYWLEDQPLAIEDDPSPAGPAWDDLLGLRMTESGGIHVNGLTNNEQLGRVFAGLPFVQTYQGGDAVPDLPDVLHPAFFFSEARHAPDDNHAMHLFAMDNQSGLALVRDGAGVVVDGELIGSDRPIPVSMGGLPGEHWDTISRLRINSAGKSLFAGFTDAGPFERDVAVVDDRIVLRSGDTIEGETLTSILRAAAMNESGDIVLFWGVQPGNVLPIGILNGRILFRRGDPVDFDGDGLPDAGYSIGNPDSSVELSERDALGNVTVYANTRLETPNGTVGALLAIRASALAPAGTSYCQPAVDNSTGGPGVMTALGSAVVSDDELVLRATNLPPNQFGYFILGGTQANVPMAGGSDGTLCVGAPLGRFSAEVQSSGAEGTVSIPVNLSSIPTNPAQPVLPGQTWNFQCWHRDVGNTSNFTDAVGVSFL
ncbi:MAG: hypothetical protein GY711_32600 [bacterium]|nr:hypothetical protein [bacterium]